MSIAEPIPEPLPVPTRDDAREFARRTLDNLRHIEQAHQFNGDTHVITQLTNSLLGLVVFPWEADVVDPLGCLKLGALEREGWPKWQIKKDRSKAPKNHICRNTLGDLVYHVRNAAAHRHLQFSSDSGKLAEVSLHLADGVPRNVGRVKTVDLYWWGVISAQDLRKWVEVLVKRIDDDLA